jgi:hypothetical protein
MVKILAATITDIVAGDAKEWDHSDPNIPDGQSVVSAYLTVKQLYADADPGLVQKHITTSYVAGQGQITADGSGSDHTAVMHFDLSPEDTLLLVPEYRNAPFVFDIQFLLSTELPYTSVIGTVAAYDQVTRAT